MLNPPKQVPDQVIETLRQAESVVIVSHIFPDADAIGSQLALGNILETLGKKVFYYCQEFALSLYEFMPGADQLSNELPDISQFDTGVSVDCGDRFRLGDKVDELLKVQPFVVIDHHAGHKEFGDISWVEGGRSSSAEMVYDLAMALGAEISYDAAFCLYTAIVSDTGSFKYESTSAYTFQVAGQLLSLGVKPPEVAGKLYDNFSLNRLRLLEKVLGSLNLYFEDQVAVIQATNEMFEASGAMNEDTEEFINLPRALRSVKVAAFLKETQDGYVKVSLRAKGECDVSLVAMNFGGGGHRNAAGFRIKGKKLEDVRDDLLQEIERSLK